MVKVLTSADHLRNDDIRQGLDVMAVNADTCYWEKWRDKVERMNEGRIVKIMLHYEPEKRCSVGRPHKCWIIITSHVT